MRKDLSGAHCEALDLAGNGIVLLPVDRLLRTLLFHDPLLLAAATIR